MEVIVATTLGGKEVGRVTDRGDVESVDPEFKEAVENPTVWRRVDGGNAVADGSEAVPKTSSEWFEAVRDTLVRTGKWIVSVKEIK